MSFKQNWRKYVFWLFILMLLYIYSLVRYEEIINNIETKKYIEAYEYLDKLKIEKPLKIKPLNLFYFPDNGGPVYSMKTDDLNGDGKNEIIYKNKNNIVIIGNDFKKQSECFSGSSTSGGEKILIVDINNDGLKEIITAGGIVSIFNQIQQKYNFPYGVGGDEYVEIDSNVPIDSIVTAELKGIIGDIEIVSKNKIRFKREDWEKIRNENYSLKIFNHECRLVSEHTISNNIGGIKLIINKNIDEDLEEEILFKLNHENNIYVLNNNLLELKNDIKSKNIIDSELKKRESLISKNKADKYKIRKEMFKGEIDLNNDGVDEIIVLARNKNSKVGFSVIYILDSSNGELLWKQSFMSYVEELVITDINSDGFKEIVVSDAKLGHFSVFGLTN